MGSKDNDNLNEIMLNIKYDSLVRISIYNLRPKNFVVIPLLKQRALSEEMKVNEKLDHKENILVKQSLEFISHNKKERNAVWFIEKNKVLAGKKKKKFCGKKKKKKKKKKK